jgi:hypothetical protein
MTGHRIGIGCAACPRANIDGMSETKIALVNRANKGVPLTNGEPSDK